MCRPTLGLLCAVLALVIAYSGCGVVGPAGKVAAGEASLRKGDWASAQKSFDEALRQRPKDPKLVLLIAQEWVKYGRWREAKRVLERAADARPTSEIYTQLAVCYHNLDDLKRAEQAYLKALELDPRNPLALNNLGYMWADQGRNLQQAIRMLEEANRLTPDQPYIMDSLGWAYYKQAVVDAEAGKAQNARRLLVKAQLLVEKAVDASPGQPEQHYHLGMIYAKLGYVEEAKAELRRALAAQSSLTEARKALQRIESRSQRPREPGPETQLGPTNVVPSVVPNAGRH